MNQDIESNNSEIKEKLISERKSTADLAASKTSRSDSTVKVIPVKPRKRFTTYQRLLRYTMQQMALVVIGNLALVINSVAQIAIPYICGQIINIITGNGTNANIFNNSTNAEENLKIVALEFIGLSLIGGLTGFIRGTCYNLIGERVIRSLRNDLFKSLLSKDVEFYDGKKAGDLLSRLSSDTAVIQGSASDSISIVIRNFIQTVGSFVILWIISYQLTLLLFLSIPLVIISVTIFAKAYKTLTKTYQSSVSDANVIASEAFGNIRIVKSFSKEDKEGDFYNEKMNATYKIGKTRAITYGVFTGVTTIIGNGAILSVLWFGGKMVLNSDLSAGNLSSFILYTITLAIALLSMNGATTSIMTSIGAAEQIFEMMDYVPKINSSGGNTHQKFEGSIELNEVTFNYPTKPEVVVLDKIKLKINSGDVVALVGSSGSGKSSIVSLIERFYDVTEGEITVDGENLKNLDLRWYHDHIGYVSQEPALFSGTIEENITYGLENYTQADVERALKLANAYDFVMNQSMFPQGLKTVVGDRGIKLSGGQKQRIAIARALIKNPKILIFDEATSALDADSEFQVQNAIDVLIKEGNKTVIVIAHRLSTIINCPRILVIQNGKIAEEGTHSQLLQKNGVYRALIERQLSGFNVNVNEL